MLNRIKGYLWIAAGIGAFYFLLTHHIVFSSVRDFDLLKKEELTLEYTFYSLRGKSNHEILSVEILRDAGIEDILLEKGKITEEKLAILLDKIDGKALKEEE